MDMYGQIVWTCMDKLYGQNKMYGQNIHTLVKLLRGDKMKTLKIEDKTWSKLTMLKGLTQAKTYSEVIEYLYYKFKIQKDKELRLNEEQ